MPYCTNQYVSKSVTDFTGDQNLQMAPILFWLGVNQPDALQNATERERLFTFEADILVNARCDISMNLKLTERVIAKEVDGVMSVEAVPEPEAPDDAEEGWTVRRC